MVNSNKKKGITHFTIVKILKKFSPEEINEFEKFLRSPFYNNQSTVIKLYSELKKYYPHFTDNKISKEFLFSAVNGGNGYDDKLFRKYFSLINKLAEEYLNVLQIRKDNEKRELNILEQLSKRDLNDVFSKKLRALENVFEKGNKIDPDNFFILLQLNLIRSNHRASQNYTRAVFEDLKSTHVSLLNYFVHETSSIINQYDTLKYSFKENNKENSFNVLFEKSRLEGYINELRKAISPENKNTIIFLDIISNSLKLNSPGGFKAYTRLKKIIKKNSGKLSKRFLYHCMKRLNIFCISEGVRGDKDMSRELFENHIFMLQNNLFDNEEINDMNLLNFRIILRTALKVNEFEWAVKFINENIKKISEESRTNVYHFGNSLLAFHKNDYSGSLRHISLISGIQTLIPMSIDIYVLKAKIFYELGYISSAKSITDSFRHYITGNQLISDYLKSVLLKFLNFYRTLIRLKINCSKSELKNFIIEIKNSKDTTERKWLIKKAEERLEAIKFPTRQKVYFG
jgi:hypothetical protein